GWTGQGLTPLPGEAVLCSLHHGGSDNRPPALHLGWAPRFARGPGWLPHHDAGPDRVGGSREVRDRGGYGDDYRDLERLGILLREGENSQRQGRDVPRDVHDRGGDRWGARHEHRTREVHLLL